MLKHDTLMKNIQPTVNALMEFPWESAAHYATWSAQTFYYVRHSTRLFATAAVRIPVTDNKVHDRLLSHMREEKGHENLSTRDIKVVGFDLSLIPELTSTKCMYQSQYYWAEHVSPYAFFGYLLALESLAIYAGPQMHERISKAHGAKASSFLRVHTEEDVNHVKEVIEWIEKMPPETQEVILSNYVFSLENYKNMVEEIRTQAFVNQLKAS